MSSNDNEWKYGVNHLFPVPIYLNHAKSRFDDIDYELNSLVDRTTFKRKDGWEDYTHTLSENPFNGDILVKNECYAFIDFLEDCMKEYLNYIGPMFEYDKFRYVITDSWFTKTVKGQQAKEHHHGYADIAGVYYVRTNGHDGNLYFNSPHSISSGNPIISNVQARELLPLAPGTLALWPGYLTHGTRVNQTDSERISLSFNIQLGRRGFDKIYDNYDGYNENISGAKQT